MSHKGGRQMVAGDTGSNEWQLPSGLQKARIQGILDYCSPCTNTCIYLLSFTSLLLAIAYSSFQFLFSTNHHHLLHINIRPGTLMCFTYICTYVHIPFHHPMNLDKVNLHIRTHKWRPFQWPGPCHKSKPKAASTSSKPFTVKETITNHNPPTQL